MGNDRHVASSSGGTAMIDVSGLFVREVVGRRRVYDFVRELKKASSIWAAGQHCPDFAWQEGCAAFTVSASHRDRVRRYIESQPEHHRKAAFIDELRILLEKHGVQYDPKYLE
jgi:transcriptional regulator GlxA family with amidase domain